MKRVMKTLRMPEPLAEALRIMSFETRTGQTTILLDALASKLESSNDTRIASFLKEYRDHQGEEPADDIPEEYR